MNYACILIGNLLTEPEFMITDAGTAICNVLISCYAGTRGGVPQLQTIRIVTFSNTAEMLSNQSHTGDKIELKGHSPVISDSKYSGEITLQIEMVAWEFRIIRSKHDD